MSRRYSIAETYKDETVLITGFTGFLGKVLVEKLLRSCPIRNVAVIVRSKKGITAEQRVQDIYKQPLFDRLRREKPDFMNKIKVLDGCLEDPLMSLLKTDFDWILENVNLIFHCAATVRFNETLELATKINVHGTEKLLLLSKKIMNLKGIVHVSTIYSHCPRKEICEEYYPVPKVANNDLNNLCANKSLTEILGVWPNTYTFTKAIAENLLAISNENHLPISIFRPSIIGCVKSEPQPGWVEGMNGPIAMVVPFILGLLRITALSENKKADIIPVDYTVNALICVMWDTINRYQNTNQLNIKPKIFNYVSSVESPITWDRFFNEMRNNYFEMPPLSAVWYIFCFNTTNVWGIKILRFFLHWIPALVGDLYLIVTGKKTK
ncbi:Hypothetical protein CINCED_3A003071 [Cinara cedri]|nr:Hypothetical protein CINCED_3A003071 [Cinara cedri]